MKMKTPKEPKISVIIPCYNQGKYIDEAVDSVLNQTYQNFEIIIVDDGSTDNYTKGLLENFKKPKTKVYRTENKGASSARNYGFRKAKGEYIQFLDADDFLDRNKFEEQMQVFKEKGKIDICYTNYKYFIDENQQYLEPSLSVALSKNPLKDFLYRWQRDLSIPIHSAIFRKKVWGKALPFIQGFGVAEDWIMWTTLAKNGSKFFLIDKTLAFYRIHQKSMTHNKSYVMYWATRAISYIADNIIEKNELEEYNIASENYVQKLIYDIYLSDKETEIARYQETLQSIYNSFSWKITRPVRILEKLVKMIRSKGIVSLMKNIIRNKIKRNMNEKETLQS